MKYRTLPLNNKFDSNSFFFNKTLPLNFKSIQYYLYILQLSAEKEEQRISQAQAEKQARLERFRRDVKQRVRQLQQIKRQENLQESFHAVSFQSSEQAY